MIPREVMWDYNQDSERELYIQYNSEDLDESKRISQYVNFVDVLAGWRWSARNAPLPKKSPLQLIKIKGYICRQNADSNIQKENAARKILFRKANERMVTLKPLWNIMPNGKITNLTLPNITLYTQQEKIR